MPCLQSANITVDGAKCDRFTVSTEAQHDFGCRISADGQASMWPDSVRIMAVSQAADELERTKQSMKE